MQALYEKRADHPSIRRRRFESCSHLRLQDCCEVFALNRQLYRRLFYLDELFYEGTGRTGRSAVLAVDPKTGKSTVRHDLPPELFGEGIVDWAPYVLEWTWTSHVCVVYDGLTLRPVTTFTYAGEGWGRARTTTELVTRDGTAAIRFRDPHTLQETRQILVKGGSKIID